MSKEIKYYYITYDPGDTFNKYPVLVKWNEIYCVQVNENVDDQQHIILQIDKVPKEDILIPKSDKYQKVRSIIKKTFLDHYNLAFKFIKETFIAEGEFYILKKGKGQIHIAYFSVDKKNQEHISIDFSDRIDDFTLRVASSTEFSQRRAFRKKAEPITLEQFTQYLHLTLQFLHDPNSYLIYMEDYLKSFYSLASGNEEIGELIKSAGKSVELIIQQLQQRKAVIEKRLIEEDSDSSTNRIRLRGELDGINYAIKTIEISS